MMQREAIEFLKRLLEIPSVNSRDDEGCMAEFLTEYLRSFGIEAQVQRIDGNHANVIAWLPGENPDQTIIWNGHLDTVPYGNTDEWKTDPALAVEKDGMIFARGASDMKSGLAAMVYALTHLSGRPAMNIQFLGTCDEEKNGIGAQRLLDDHKLAASTMMLIGEPTGMKLGTAQKGCLWLKLHVRGKTSHGAYPQEGISAIHEGMRIAEGIRSYVQSFSSDLLGVSTAQVTMITGGCAPNMTADECEIVMDIRMVPGLTAHMVMGQGEKLLREYSRSNIELKAEFEILNDRRAIEISDEHPMVSSMRKLLIERGYEGSDVGISFFTDASVLDRDAEKAILLFGPGDPSMAHRPNEYVETEKYLDAIEVLKRFAAAKLS